MYAIIRTGGKQAKVKPGDVIDVELLKGDAEELEFAPLLVVDDAGDAITGRTALAGAKVLAKVVGASKGPKIDIFTYKNKTGSSRHIGHRQKYTTIEVTGIELPGTKQEPKPQEEPAEAKGADGAAEAKAPKKPAEAKAVRKPAEAETTETSTEAEES